MCLHHANRLPSTKHAHVQTLASHASQCVKEDYTQCVQTACSNHPSLSRKPPALQIHTSPCLSFAVA